MFQSTEISVMRFLYANYEVRIVQTPIRCNPAEVTIEQEAMSVVHNAIQECNGTLSRTQNENVIVGDSNSVTLKHNSN